MITRLLARLFPVKLTVHQRKLTAWGGEVPRYHTTQRRGQTQHKPVLRWRRQA